MRTWTGTAFFLCWDGAEKDWEIGQAGESVTGTSFKKKSHARAQGNGCAVSLLDCRSDGLKE
jgi:hypothetical protein